MNFSEIHLLLTMLFFIVDMAMWIWWLLEKTQKENTVTLNMKYASFICCFSFL